MRAGPHARAGQGLTHAHKLTAAAPTRAQGPTSCESFSLVDLDLPMRVVRSSPPSAPPGGGEGGAAGEGAAGEGGACGGDGLLVLEDLVLHHALQQVQTSACMLSHIARRMPCCLLFPSRVFVVPITCVCCSHHVCLLFLSAV